MQGAGQGIFPKIGQPQQGRKSNPPHAAPESPLLGVKAVRPHPLMAQQMQGFIFLRVVGLLEHRHIVCAALVEITVFVGIDRVDFQTHHAEILPGQFAGFADVRNVTVFPAFPGEQENLLHAAAGNDFHFMADLIHGQFHSLYVIITIKSTVHAVIFTIIGNIQRRKQIYRIAEMLAGFQPGPLGHLLQKRLRRRGQQRLKIRNGDGIDLDHSCKVRIADCFIESGDDCICLKNRREFEEYGSCEDIVVSNCVMTSRSCAIKIGSENMDVINNVLFNNCIIRGSNRGVGIQNRDEGTVTNVVFSNMLIDCQFFSDVWWGKAEPIYVTSYPRAVGNHKDAGWRFPKGATEGRCGEVSRIYFTNIKCTSENGVFVGGDVPGKVNHIFFKDVDVLLYKRTGYPGGIYDKRPCLGEGFVHDSTYGFYIDTASDIFIEDSRIMWGDTKPDKAADGVMQKNAHNVVIE